MKPKAPRSAGDYRRSFILLTAVGSGILFLYAVARGVEMYLPKLKGELAPDLLAPVLICWFIASLHYAKYLHLLGQTRAKEEAAERGASS